MKGPPGTEGRGSSRRRSCRTRGSATREVEFVRWRSLLTGCHDLQRSWGCREQGGSPALERVAGTVQGTLKKGPTCPRADWL